MLHFHVLIIENVLATLLVSTRTVVANISSGLCDKTMFATVGSDICNRTSVANISFGVRAHSNFTVSFVSGIQKVQFNIYFFRLLFCLIS